MRYISRHEGELIDVKSRDSGWVGYDSNRKQINNCDEDGTSEKMNDEDTEKEVGQGEVGDRGMMGIKTYILFRSVHESKMQITESRCVG